MPTLSERENSFAHCFGPTTPFVEFRKEEIEQSIPVRFEQIVRKYPDRIAIKTPSHSVTYDELNRSANRIARAVLEMCGAGNEPVALHLGHGAGVISAILGVLKAGKMYVYLDPRHPKARLASLLADSGAGLMLTDGKNISQSAEFAEPPVQRIDIDRIDDGVSTENPGLAVSPDSFAWLLYTSGSTGRPKGVIHNHRNLLHNVMTYTNSMHICVEDRLTLLHSCGLVTAVKNCFGALLNGAILYPFNVKDEGLQQLVDWIIQEEITIYHSVPTLFRRMTDLLMGEERFPKLRLIALGSEPVTKNDVEQYKRHFSPDCILVNMLGSTELGTNRQYFVDKRTPMAGAFVPAGYEVEGKEIRLLDEDHREIGFNAIGEIAVKSRYMAVGYWLDPETTRASFLDDPNGGDERIYLTGDLGRMLPDGCLLHLGRKDFQVKIRGHRVDVAEVEAALLEHSAVREAVIVAQEALGGEKRLIAYVVPEQGVAITVGELRGFALRNLPEHMTPSGFVLLDKLPLSPDGKVDRQALPFPEPTRPELGESFVEAQNEAETIIARIWGEVLQLDKVGIHDSFFELGGNSLLLMEAHAKLTGIFRKDLSVTELFEYPTISSLAGYLSREANDVPSVGHEDRISRLKTGQTRLKKQSDARRKKA